MAKGSSASASATGSAILDLELAGVDGERSFDDKETTNERETD